MNMNLTSKQQFWRDHVLAAKRDQLTYADYAKQHDLNLQAMYSWSMTLRRKGMLEQEAPAFAEVKVERPAVSSAAPTGVRVRLVNGVELEQGGLNEQLVKWLAAL